MRKAAALLASLHAADRQWLLGQLPVAAAKELGPLVSAAMPLVEKISGSLEEALNGSFDAPQAELPAPGMFIDLVNELDEDWASRVLMAVDSHHADIYLAACQRDRAMRIRRDIADNQSALPAALARCLCSALADRADAVNGRSP